MFAACVCFIDTGEMSLSHRQTEKKQHDNPCPIGGKINHVNQSEIRIAKRGIWLLRGKGRFVGLTAAIERDGASDSKF